MADRHLYNVGEDCLVSFDVSLYSVPAALVTAGMTVEVRATADRVLLRRLGPEPVLLTEHRRGRHRRDDQIDPTHWHGLPDGSTRPSPPAAPTSAAATMRPHLVMTPSSLSC